MHKSQETKQRARARDASACSRGETTSDLRFMHQGKLVHSGTDGNEESDLWRIPPEVLSDP
jgi:hypothetical protein